MGKNMRQLEIITTMASLVLLCGAAAAQAPQITWEAPTPPTNAALVYYRAFLVLTPLGDKGNTAEDKAFSKLIEKGEYDSKHLDPYVERNSEALGLLLRASAIDHCDFGVEFNLGPAAPLPELARARELARLGAAAIRRATEAADWDRAADLFCAVLRLARGTHEEGTLIGSLVAAAIIDIVNSQAGRFLAEMPPDDARYSRMEGTLAQVAPALDDWSMAIEGEKKLQAMLFPPPGTVLSRDLLLGRVNDIYASFPEPGEGEPRREAVWRIAQGTSSPEDRAEVAKAVECSPDDLATLEGISAVATRCGVQVMSILQEIETALALPYPAGQPQLAAIMKKVPTLGPAPRAFIPALAAMHFRKTKATSRLAMMQMALAVLRWKTANGALPKTPGDLASATPTDPFTDGQPFAYGLLDSGGFTLTGKGTENPDGKAPLIFVVARQ